MHTHHIMQKAKRGYGVHSEQERAIGDGVVETDSEEMMFELIYECRVNILVKSIPQAKRQE